MMHMSNVPMPKVPIALHHFPSASPLSILPLHIGAHVIDPPDFCIAPRFFSYQHGCFHTFQKVAPSSAADHVTSAPHLGSPLPPRGRGRRVHACAWGVRGRAAALRRRVGHSCACSWCLHQASPQACQSSCPDPCQIFILQAEEPARARPPYGVGEAARHPSAQSACRALQGREHPRQLPGLPFTARFRQSPSLGASWPAGSRMWTSAAG